jgi:DNA-binding transcriptional regulator YiaG
MEWSPEVECIIKYNGKVMDARDVNVLTTAEVARILRVTPTKLTRWEKER